MTIPQAAAEVPIAGDDPRPTQRPARHHFQLSLCDLMKSTSGPSKPQRRMRRRRDSAVGAERQDVDESSAVRYGAAQLSV
jgi:hypothetical protein